MNWFKRKARAAWLRFKRLWIALLVSLGLIAVPVLYAAPVNIQYTAPTEYSDGTPIPLYEVVEIRFYCDDTLVLTDTTVETVELVTVDLSVGTHQCYATAVDTFGRESLPSNTVTRVVEPPGTGPNPPVLSVD